MTNIPENDKLYLLEIQEIERKRISNELHDTTVQNLTMLIHKIELCEQLIDKDTLWTKLELAIMKDTLRKTIQELRTIIYNLRPMSIDDLGLLETVERFISQKEYTDQLMEISFEYQGQEPKNINPIILMTLFRIIREIYNNAEKYAEAQNFNIILKFDTNNIYLKIWDDGKGFDLEKISLDGKNFGLSILKERVDLLSGKVNIETAKDKGTSITIEVPLEEEESYVD
jgi:two-component system sensor histidine kinase DegS